MLQMGEPISFTEEAPFKRMKREVERQAPYVIPAIKQQVNYQLDKDVSVDTPFGTRVVKNRDILTTSGAILGTAAAGLGVGVGAATLMESIIENKRKLKEAEKQQEKEKIILSKKTQEIPKKVEDL